MALIVFRDSFSAKKEDSMDCFQCGQKMQVLGVQFGGGQVETHLCAPCDMNFWSGYRSQLSWGLFYPTQLGKKVEAYFNKCYQHAVARSLLVEKHEKRECLELARGE